MSSILTESPVEGPKSVVIGFNPGSGASDRTSRVEAIAARLRSSGFAVTVSSSIDQAVERGSSLHQAGELRAFVVAGGDGTIRVMAERLPVGVPLVLFPMGTENLLARHLGLTSKPADVVDRVINGKGMWLDAGTANGRLFLVMASCGFDADVVQRMHGGRKGNITRLSWLRPTAGAIRRYAFPELTIRTADGQEISGHRWAFVFNAPRYAMQLNMAPEADMADGMLDLCTFRRGGLFLGLAYIATIFLGRHRQWTGGEHLRTTKVSISSNEQVPWQLDGDPGGYLPLEIGILPRRIMILGIA